MAEKQNRMNKIFLTGTIQIGKSTVVDKVIGAYPGMLGGFRTWFGADRNMPNRFLYISDVYKTRVREAVRFEDGVVKEIYLDSFNEFGTGLLHSPPEAGIIIMDELGRLEGRAEAFKAAVMKALGAETPILGVLRHDARGWLEDIRAHPDVRIIEVTQENRNGLPEEVLSALC